MKSNKKHAFTLIELIIYLMIISIFLYTIHVSETAYFKFIERKQVENVVESLTYAARVSVTTSSMTTITILNNNKTMEIKFDKDNSKKIIELPEGLKFHRCNKHEYKYNIYPSMAPSLGGMIHITGQYYNYDIVFPVAIARFRLIVKRKNIPICE